MKRVLSVIAVTLTMSMLTESTLAVVVVADSQADFSSAAQGVNGWYYRGIEAVNGADGSAFDPSSYPNGRDLDNTNPQFGPWNSWAFGPESWWPMLSSGSFNTGTYNTASIGNVLTMRRWVSDVTEPLVSIDGSIDDVIWGTGQDVSLDVRVNGISIGTAFDPEGNNPPTLFSFTTSLAIGDTVDFLVGKPNAAVGQNGSGTFSAVITAVPEPSTALLIPAALAGLKLFGRRSRN